MPVTVNLSGLWKYTHYEHYADGCHRKDYTDRRFRKVHSWQGRRGWSWCG